MVQKLIIGPTWTAGGLPVAPLAKDDDLIITSPSLGVAEFNEAGDNIFNVWPHDDIATRELARYAWDNGHRTTVIFSAKAAWYHTQAIAFEDEFKSIGGTVYELIETSLEERDLKTEAAKILSLNPDFVLYTNLDNLGIMARELRTLGYEGEQYSILMDETRVDQAQGALEGAIYVQYAPATSAFRAAYNSRFGKEPGITADTAYDAVYLYKKSYRGCRSA